MACRDAYRARNMDHNTTKPEGKKNASVKRLLFGVDSAVPANRVLQNNLTEFEWVERNKIYPNFWGRNITGKNCLTKDEIVFLHGKGCKIAAIYEAEGEKLTEEQGKVEAKKVAVSTLELGVPRGTAIFLEIGETEKLFRTYMKGYAEGLLEEGYIPGFKANTDGKYGFDREYSGGLQAYKEPFEKSMIWAVAPTLKEYDQMTATHLIHPDNWKPFAPSGITRKDIAIWQYGKNCHPIQDEDDQETVFHLDLVTTSRLIIERMF